MTGVGGALLRLTLLTPRLRFGCPLKDLSPRPWSIFNGVCRSGHAWPDRSLITRPRHWSARPAVRHAPLLVSLATTKRTRMAKKPKKRRITGGVDTHKDTHHAAVVLMNGRRL